MLFLKIVSSDHYCSVLKSYWDLLFDDEHGCVPENNLILGEINCEYMLPIIFVMLPTDDQLVFNWKLIEFLGKFNVSEHIMFLLSCVLIPV